MTRRHVYIFANACTIAEGLSDGAGEKPRLTIASSEGRSSGHLAEPIFVYYILQLVCMPRVFFQSVTFLPEHLHHC